MPILDEIILTFTNAAPYLLLGLLCSALIQSFITKEQITRWIGQKNFRSVLIAATAGVPMPLCSCGVIPMAMSLRKNGASRGATTSFLISTPEIGLDSVMLSLALLDPLMAIFRPIAAFVTALIAGIMENFFDRTPEQAFDAPKAGKPSSCCAPKEAQTSSMITRLKQGFYYSFVTLLGDIALWLLLGLALSGVISYLVPAEVVERYLGHGVWSVLLALVVGIPLYICASASTPIAASLLLKGASPAAALVFLLAGPATNVTTIVMVYKFLGKRALAIYLSTIAICAVGFGFLLNWLYDLWSIDIKKTMGQAAHCVDSTVQIVAGIVLLVLIVYALYVKHFQGDNHHA